MARRYASGVGAMVAVGFVLRTAGAVATRPRLWATTLMQLRRFASDRWWRRPPFLPLPPAGLVGFRAETMYGDRDAVPSADDMIVWLEWCRTQAARGKTRPSRSR